ncbi:Uncharacterised protein [Vibrio cholerae]|uniref:Uncharacterized protein n=1 Tax=Vibrio cholerae TaxID=666 RepID=A0A655XZJ0_VIBCL|nr:Uncharacterised protein [Vibrio cholerae]CSB28129.1 Uncharacterised protein [Vibrio cholerae]CSB67231.1 Uncharacterised protein [Vibrio cholerae]CSB70046.1 Uncharacterised protein [Vibrio cholerae]CSC09154.1 Uncharacterised protein [Vibrio cholerae]
MRVFQAQIIVAWRREIGKIDTMKLSLMPVVDLAVPLNSELGNGLVTTSANQKHTIVHELCLSTQQHRLFRALGFIANVVGQ